MFNHQARSRYNRDVVIFSASYAVSLIGGTAWFRNHPGNIDATAYLVALVPALSIVAIFGAIGRYLIAESDEYLRMLMVRQSLVASGIALGSATIWGFLESFGLTPHVEAYWVAVIWFAGLGVGGIVNAVVERR